MKIKFVCGKTFYMTSGTESFIKGDVYEFTQCSDGVFQTQSDALGRPHRMNVKSMFVTAQMIPYQAILENKERYED